MELEHDMSELFYRKSWKDKNGNNPDVFTVITLKDIEEGKYVLVDEQRKNESIKYVKNLEKQQKKLYVKEEL